MNGQDLIELAGRIAANPALGVDEARFRSAVSRAYFGAFRQSRQLLAEFDVSVRRSAFGHRDVYMYLFNSGHADAQEAARLFDELRTERNIADYDFESQKFTKLATTMASVELASDIKSLLDTCGRDPARAEIQQGIEEFTKEPRSR